MTYLRVRGAQEEDQLSEQLGEFDHQVERTGLSTQLPHNVCRYFLEIRGGIVKKLKIRVKPQSQNRQTLSIVSNSVAVTMVWQKLALLLRLQNSVRIRS